MASLIILAISCSKSLYKAGKKHRNKKRERELVAAIVDKPNVRRRSAVYNSRRPRRVLLPNANQGLIGPAHREQQQQHPRPYEMTSGGRSDLYSLRRASTITAAETVTGDGGGGRRRMSDESTLAEVARELGGTYTART